MLGVTAAIDERRVYLPPRGSGAWYNRDPGVFHTSESCGSRGTGFREEARTRLVFLERAVKEGYRPCGICATEIEHEFQPADYPPGTRAEYPGGEAA